jgi:hypothetical protein
MLELQDVRVYLIPRGQAEALACGRAPARRLKAEEACLGTMLPLFAKNLPTTS